MSRIDRTPVPELDPIFDAAKAIDPVADVTRARALARARATVAAAALALPPDVMRGPPAPLRLALAVGLAFVLGATGAVAAFLRHGARATPKTAQGQLAQASTVALLDRPLRGNLDVRVPPRTKAPRDNHAMLVRTSHAAEVALIQRAQAAYAEGNLSAALEDLAAHERRFPNGWLAEEREALQVQSLARCGRLPEAHRALRRFASRFPHSMLLHHLRQALAAPAPDPQGGAQCPPPSTRAIDEQEVRRE